jgi:peptide deformylase
MGVKKVRKIGDPVLREKSKKVEKVDESIMRLVRDLTDTLKETGGVGMAAPQIGVTRRVVIINVDNKIHTFINPEIEVLDGQKIRSDEGCLSIYSIKDFNVKRFSRVKVRAKNLKWKDIEVEAEGLLARIFQHEIDHLNGVLFMDHLDQKSKEELLSRINDIKLNINDKGSI